MKIILTNRDIEMVPRALEQNGNRTLGGGLSPNQWYLKFKNPPCSQIDQNKGGFLMFWTMKTIEIFFGAFGADLRLYENKGGGV